MNFREAFIEFSHQIGVVDKDVHTYDPSAEQHSDDDIFTTLSHNLTTKIDAQSLIGTYLNEIVTKHAKSGQPYSGSNTHSENQFATLNFSKDIDEHIDNSDKQYPHESAIKMHNYLMGLNNILAIWKLNSHHKPLKAS